MLKLAKALGCKKKQESNFEKLRKKFRGSTAKTNEDDMNGDWKGPPLGTNVLLLNPDIKIVKHIAIGEGHMVALVQNEMNMNALWGMGTTKWGQLGLDPHDHVFYEHLIELNIKNANSVEHYPMQVDCGYSHTLILFEKKHDGEQVVVQLGNILANHKNDYIMELAPKGRSKHNVRKTDEKTADKNSQKTQAIRTNHNLKSYYEG